MLRDLGLAQVLRRVHGAVNLGGYGPGADAVDVDPVLSQLAGHGILVVLALIAAPLFIGVYDIAGAPDGTQVRVLKRIIKKGLSVRQAEELVRSLTEQPAAAAQNVEDEEYPESYSRLVEQLEKFFSQDISIKRSKNGGGRIVIGFGDDKDIEQFIERFSGRIK